MLNTPTHEFLTSLEAAMPGLTSEATQAYLEEPRGIYQGRAEALLRPRDTGEVAEICRRANAARVGLIPYSGGTGLVGGQLRGEADGPPICILSLERMSAITEVDASDRTLVAQAGAILANIQNAATDAGLLFPLSLASEGSCRIGGNLATNAGGVNVIRYGNARDLCLGIEAVLADGTVIHGLKSLKKDNTGYDLRHLLIGAEGTLGVITAARLKLYDAPAERVTALLAVENPRAALSLLRSMQGQFGEWISAFELIDQTGVRFMKETMPEISLPPGVDARWMVLVEVGAGEGLDVAERFEAALGDALENGQVLDGHIAQSGTQAAAIWNMRETIPLANRKIGAIISNDISVPIGRVPEFIEVAGAALAKIGDFRINSFGHLGDGNLHYNIFPPAGQQKGAFSNLTPAIRDCVHGLVDEFGGSISAEHGIGRIKRDELERYGDPGKLTAMRAIKAALDPNGIMNPGAVIATV